MKTSTVIQYQLLGITYVQNAWVSISSNHFEMYIISIFLLFVNWFYIIKQFNVIQEYFHNHWDHNFQEGDTQLQYIDLLTLSGIVIEHNTQLPII